MKINRCIFLIIIFIFFSCNTKIKELYTSYFNYDKQFIDKLDKIKSINKLLDYNKKIKLIKTNLFYVSNRYVLPFFYFEFQDALMDLTDDSSNFYLSKEEITDYFLYVAEARTINRLMLIEAKNLGINVEEKEVYDKISSLIEENFETDIESFKEKLKNTMFTYDFFENDNKESLIIEKYKKEFIFKNIEPKEEELIDYYNQNPSLSLIKERAVVRHILMLTHNLTEKEKIKKYELLKNIREMALNGKDFGELAKKYSEDETTKKSGGLIGEYLERGQTFKEFEDAAFNTKEGGVSEIIETDYGYHFLKVDKFEKEKKLSFEEIKDRIYKFVKTEKENIALEKEKERLKKKYNFKIIGRLTIKN